MSRWCKHDPEWAADVLRSANTDWWVSGGWALEMFAGRPLRDHSDLEIGCFRRDVPNVLSVLSDWDVQIARNKVLSPFDATAAQSDRTIHGLWCRHRGSELWDLEILLEEREGLEWIYRRDDRIHRAVGNLYWENEAGVPYLQPDVQLLYKSRNIRPKDHQDFAVVWPLLTRYQQTWLTNAIRLTAPECQWV